MNNIKKLKETLKLNFHVSNSLPLTRPHKNHWIFRPFLLANLSPHLTHFLPSLGLLWGLPTACPTPTPLHWALPLLTRLFYFLYFWCFDIWDLDSAGTPPPSQSRSHTPNPYTPGRYPPALVTHSQVPDSQGQLLFPRACWNHLK